MKTRFELDHIGVAVESIEKASKLYKSLGWVNIPTEIVESEKVKVGFVEFANHTDVELLEATTPDSTISKFIAKRGEGIHHICFRVPDVQAAIDQLKADGYRLIDDKPRKGAKNCLVAFVHPSSTGGVLIELSQKMNSTKGA